DRGVDVRQLHDAHCVPQQVRQRLARQIHVDGASRHPAEVTQAVQRPLQLTDVAAQLSRQILQYLLVDEGVAAPDRLRTEDVQARLGVRRGQAPDSATEQSVD